MSCVINNDNNTINDNNDNNSISNININNDVSINNVGNYFSFFNISDTEHNINITKINDKCYSNHKKNIVNYDYDNDNSIHYIYMLKEREFIKTKENVFKIGKTTQNNLGRFSQYPNGSILYFQMICKDCHKIEKIIINSFRLKYINRSDIGTEYFQGDHNDMIDDIYYEICKFHKRLKEDNIRKQQLKSINFDNFKYTHNN